MTDKQVVKVLKSGFKLQYAKKKKEPKMKRVVRWEIRDRLKGWWRISPRYTIQILEEILDQRGRFFRRSDG